MSSEDIEEEEDLEDDDDDDGDESEEEESLTDADSRNESEHTAAEEEESSEDEEEEERQRQKVRAREERVPRTPRREGDTVRCHCQVFERRSASPENQEYLKLHNAVKEGNSTALRELLASSDGLRYINHADRKSGETPLLLAAGGGNLEMVCDLIESGGDLSLGNHSCQTPFMAACHEGHLCIVDHLLTHHKETIIENEPRPDKLVRNAISACNDNISVLERLEAHGFDIPTTAMVLNGEVDANHPNMVGFLIDKGCDPNSAQGIYPPLISAAISGRTEVIRVLLSKGARVDLLDKGSRPASALHYSAYSGHTEAVKLILEAGGDPNILIAEDSSTPLHFAALKNHAGVVSALIEAGADVSKLNLHGMSALHVCAENGSTECALLLMQAAAPVNTTSALSMTPLLSAVDFKSIPIWRELVERGADLTAANSTDQTVLHLLAIDGTAEQASVLEGRQGLNLEARDKQSCTPLFQAAYGKNLSLMTWLLEKGARVDAREEMGGLSMLHECARVGFVAGIRLLVSRGLNVNDNESKNRDTPLHLAALNARWKSARALLELGAVVDVPDKDGETALMRAAPKGYLRTSRLLLDAGGDLHREYTHTHSGVVMHRLAYRGKTSVISLFLERGARVDQRTEQGTIPLHYAVYAAHRSAFTVLLKHHSDLEDTSLGDTTPLSVAVERISKDKDGLGGRRRKMKNMIRLMLREGVKIVVVGGEGIGMKW